MAVETVIGLGMKWVPRLWSWYSSQAEEKKDLLNEVNAVLTQDPRELARLYVEPDLQLVNPANMEDDEPDEEDEIFRQPAYRWLDSFLIKPRRRDGRHVAFVLSDSGMGKSSLLAMLRLTSAQGRWPGINFKLLKLGETSLSDIQRYKHPVETVLLLDSLDEDPLAFGRIESRIIKLLKATTQFRQVIITCRTQFFPLRNYYERDGARIKISGFSCKTIYLSLFSEVQIDAYLKKVFSKSDDIDRAKALVLRMKSLRMRPMLLANIEDLLERQDQIEDWTSFGVHEALVDAWLDREERKSNNKVTAQDLRDACHIMATYLQEARRQTISSINLEVFFAQEDVPAAISSVAEFGGRSLLNKNSDGDYRFAHYSIQEFLVVDYMARHPEKTVQYSSKIRFSDELVAFLVNWTHQAPESWEANLTGANLGRAKLTAACLRSANFAHATLHAAELNRADLSGADLSRADLSRADLEAVDLSGANLSKADLEGAVLRTANLDGADLSDADLRNADIEGASFIGARLSGANLSGLDFSSNERISREQVTSAIIDEETKLPKKSQPSTFPSMVPDVSQLE
ncbi:MAG: pentapeptide repeat-containing protein [bacterium]|nr:pentapeptide repeat-containing protein [bacterium]